MNPPSHSDMPLLSFAPYSLGLALVSLCTELGSEVAIFCARAQLMHRLVFGDQKESVTCYFFLGGPHWIRIACTLPKQLFACVVSVLWKTLGNWKASSYAL